MTARPPVGRGAGNPSRPSRPAVHTVQPAVGHLLTSVTDPTFTSTVIESILLSAAVPPPVVL